MMNELLEKNQLISVVPQNFKNSNKGKIIEVKERNFLLELFHEPEDILLNNLIEFYSQTKNGMLYFTSDVTNIEGNIITIKTPLKHRFLQRRAFTRVKFIKDMNWTYGDTSHKITSLDLSFGGMKLKTKEHLDINKEYDISIPLLKGQEIKCKFQPIRIEKNDDEYYTLSGRFKNISDIDKMTLTQFCMRRKIENANK